MKQLLRWPGRALGRDKNPLLRRSDRIEAAARTGLILIFLAAAPVLGVSAGRAEARSDAAVLSAERSWHQVPAQVLGITGQSSSWDSPDLVAGWTAPGGQRRTGKIAAAELVNAGQRVPVWVDGAGRLTYQPMARWQRAWDAVIAAVAVPVALGLLLGLAGGCIHLVLGRRRRDWEQEWSTTGARWSRSA
jgi:hypothetical protein